MSELQELQRLFDERGDLLHEWAIKLTAQDCRIRELEAALRSIASNTCCDKCQEAALVAKKTLRGDKGER